METTLAITLLIPSLLAITLAILSIKKKYSTLYKLFVYILISSSLYTMLYCIQLLSTSIEVSKIAFCFKKSLVPVNAALVLVSVIQLTKYIKKPKVLDYLIIAISILFGLNIFLNPFTHMAFEIYSLNNFEFMYEHSLAINFCDGFTIFTSIISLVLLTDYYLLKRMKIDTKALFIFYLAISRIVLFLFENSSSIYVIDYRSIFAVFTSLAIYINFLMGNNIFSYLKIRCNAFDLIDEGLLITNENYILKDYNMSLVNIFKDIDFVEALENSVLKTFANYPSVLYCLKSSKVETLQVYDKVFTVVPNSNPEICKKNKILTLSFRDTTQYIESVKKINNLSSYDYLTRLRSKNSFNDLLVMEINKFIRYNMNFALMCIDVDNFSSIVDNYDYVAGDNTLIKIANVISDQTRKTDVCCRYDGDTFMVLLTNARIKYTSLVAERIRRDIENLTIKYNSERISTTVSIGIINSQNLSSELYTDYIEEAKRVTEKAKSKGKNCIVTVEKITERS